MKKIVALILLVLSTNCVSFCQNIPPPAAWREHKSKDYIPNSMLQFLAYSSKFNVDTILLANPKDDFRQIDVLTDENRNMPIRRLVLYAECENYYIISYEHYVFGSHIHLVLISRDSEGYFFIVATTFIEKNERSLRKMLHIISTEASLKERGEVFDY